MGVRKRNAIDLASQQLQQTHRKCHHRQSPANRSNGDDSTPSSIHPNVVLYNEPQVKPPKQQYNAKHQRKVKQHLECQQQHPQQHQLQNTPIHSGQVIQANRREEQKETRRKTKTKRVFTLKSHTQLPLRLKSSPSTTTTATTSTTTTTTLLSKKIAKNFVNCCQKRLLNSVCVILLLIFTCLSSPCHPNLHRSSSSSSSSHTLQYLAKTTTITTTFLLSTSVGMGLAASTYEPIIKFDLVNSDDDGMAVEDIDVNSNEQQLLAYYKKAQKEHEDELKRQHFRQQQQQHEQKHHQQERDIDRITLQPALDMDDIIPTSDVISSLNMVEDFGKQKKSAASKRSTTKHGSSTVAPTTLSTTTVATTTTSATGSTTTARSTVTTAAVEEKCEAKVLDEIPAEPVSFC